MNSIVAERKIHAALTRNVPPAAHRTYKIGEEVLVYNDKNKKWEGLYIVIDCTGRTVTIRSIDGTSRRMFNAFQITPYFRDYQENFYSLKSMSDDNELLSVFITEVIETNDPRASKFDKAKQKEIEGLLKRKTWKIVCRGEVSDNANILIGRFVLAIKDVSTDKEIWKAGFVVQGH